MARPTEDSKHNLAIKTILCVSLAAVLVVAFAPRDISGGFICGALAFCFSALALRRLTTRIVQKGQVAEGVRSGVFWLIFKFVAPAAMIFWGLSVGVSPAAVVFGIVSGLAAFSAILWLARDEKF